MMILEMHFFFIIIILAVCLDQLTLGSAGFAQGASGKRVPRGFLVFLIGFLQ